MRSRVTAAVIAIAILLAVGLFLTRGAEKQLPKRDPIPPKPVAPVPDVRRPAEAASVDVVTTLAKEIQDLAAARRALSRGLSFMSARWTGHWAIHLESLHGGACPEFREFARAFLAAAGPDLIPIVKSLLAECASEESKFLLAAVLGEARKPEVVGLLKELVAQSPGSNVTASALHSIGMSRSPDALQFLTTWLTSYRAGESKDHGHLETPALAAIGQVGGEAFEFLVAEARRRTNKDLPSAADVVGWIRGSDAVDKLRVLFETEKDWSLRAGAARALGFASDPAALEYWLTRADYGEAGLSLLAARNVPDVWEATAAARRDVADRLITAAGVPSGDPKRDLRALYLASLLPPDRARALYESLTDAVRADPNADARGQIISMIRAFADQPDMPDRAQRMREVTGINAQDYHRALDLGLTYAAIPGKGLGASTLVEMILGRATNPATHPTLVNLAMQPIMHCGISEADLSTALQDAWNLTTSNDARRTLLDGVIYGSNAGYPLQGSITWTQPESFVASVLRETADPALRLRAAYAYLVNGDPSVPDAVAVKALSDMMSPMALTALAATPRGEHLLGPLVGAWYARFGTASDVERLQTLPESFPYPESMSARERAALRDALTLESRRAIDAIRLASTN